jgi:hypothetical protein
MLLLGGFAATQPAQRFIPRCLPPRGHRSVTARAGSSNGSSSSRRELLAIGLAAAVSLPPSGMAAQPMEVEVKAEPAGSGAAALAPQVGKDIPRAELAPGLEISRIVKVPARAAQRELSGLLLLTASAQPAVSSAQHFWDTRPACKAFPLQPTFCTFVLVCALFTTAANPCRAAGSSAAAILGSEPAPLPTTHPARQR